MSHKQNEIFSEKIWEVINEIVEDKKLTPADKINEIDEFEVSIEDRMEALVKALGEVKAELEKSSCKECEGVGHYSYREYFEKCRGCSGTGYKSSGPSENERD